jgi:hypothetical protein
MWLGNVAELNGWWRQVAGALSRPSATDLWGASGDCDGGLLLLMLLLLLLLFLLLQQQLHGCRMRR